MKLTLQIKLLPTGEQAVMLKNTFSVFNEACNTISQIAWERHAFKQFSLHKEVYYPIKDTYHLSSQLVVRAISKVADAYKHGLPKNQKFFGKRRNSGVTELSCLHGSERYAVCFDARQAAVAGVARSRDPFHEL